ncbi:MAG: LamG domain-containing protein [Planctomycetes bacterium]|nr:LamG domain-containing protein [Planctomycetota bacterium]
MGTKRRVDVVLVVWLTMMLGVMVSGVSAQVDPNLAGWWKLDEVSGTVADDETLGGHDGSLVGDPVWAAGVDNNGLEFDGVGDGIHVAHHEDLNLGTGAFTLSAWIRNENTVDSAWKRIITKREDVSATAYYSLAINDNQLTMEVTGSPGGYTVFSGGPAIQGDGLWHHVAGVRDEAGNVYLYVDGVEYAVGVCSNDVSNTKKLEIGKFWSEASDGETFKGRMDDVRIYTLALAAERIKQMAEFASAPNPSDGATGISVETLISFTANPSATSHDVYFDTVNPPVFPLANDSTETSFDPCTLPLEYGQRYYWQVKENTSAGTVAGAVWAFTTFAAPEVTTQPATRVSKTRARLNGFLDSMGDSADVDVRFEYGETSGGPYDHQTGIEIMTATGDFDIDIINLDSETTYYYRAAVYGEDNSVAYGEEESFMTVPWQGIGTEGDPYQIGTVEHLQKLSINSVYWDDPCNFFEVTTDIAIDSGTVIDPIGNDTIPFKGNFNGGGYTISGLTQSGSSYLGLFGKTGSSGQIINLSLTEADISGTGDYIGILAGWNEGVINDCSAAGAVSGHSEVGGLVGRNENGSITNCYADAAVSGGDYSSRLGGLVGFNTTDDDITAISIVESYATGTVTAGIDSRSLGGLCGSNYGKNNYIMNCYATGSVTGGITGENISRWLGGLVGENYGRIKSCYATGAFTSDYYGYAGGLVGLNEGNDIALNSFYDVETSGFIGSKGGLGLSTEHMKTVVIFIAFHWDFENIWNIVEGQTYPYLRTQGLPEQCGDMDHPFPVGDLSGDCVVNLLDWALFCGHWLEDIR